MGFGEALSVLVVMSIPLVAILTSHQRKMAEIKARNGVTEGTGVVDARSAAQLAALQQEVALLRETATRFDLSFDSALTRLEQRVERVETNQMSATAPLSRSAVRQWRGDARTNANAGARGIAVPWRTIFF